MLLGCNIAELCVFYRSGLGSFVLYKYHCITDTYVPVSVNEDASPHQPGPY